MEYIHHLIACDEIEDAVNLLTNEGRGLVSKGHMEVLTLLERVPFENLADSDGARLHQLSGEVLALQGRLEDAHLALASALEGALNAKDRRTASEVRSTLADVALKQGRPDEALDLHREALEGFIAMEDEQGATRTYNNMGYLLRRKTTRRQHSKRMHRSRPSSRPRHLPTNWSAHASVWLGPSSILVKWTERAITPSRRLSARTVARSACSTLALRPFSAATMPR